MYKPHVRWLRQREAIMFHIDAFPGFTADI
jgi:hypothetical protein